MARSEEYPAVDPDSERPPILPPMPQKPPRPAAPEAASSEPKSPAAAIAGAVVGLILLSAILFVCSAGNPLAILVALGIFGFAGMHYVLWGWWLGRMIHRENEDE